MSENPPFGARAVETAPVLVHATRGAMVESAHRATLVVTAPNGETWLERGAVNEPILPRSSLKPLQTLAMLQHGLDLPPDLLTLVSSSHSGEEVHRHGVRRILATVGLTEDALRNTPSLPIGEVEHARWLATGRPAASIAQDCSGKHAGMLATCVINGWPVEGYLDGDHPLQRAIADLVTRWCGPIAFTAVDGCGAPVPTTPLAALAHAFGRLATAPQGTDEHRIAEAIRAHPEMLGGDGRDVTAVIRALPGVIAKDGAESVYAAGTADGYGVAVKVTDGAPFPRARQVLLASALTRVLEASGAQVPAALEALTTVPVLGHGQPVGSVHVVGF
ncbi:asparaginase [Janibacter sp. GXQ6167]|uniref:asparaginase n=1 Tax=Janibacter sp. GXQ6167 TaxID=3240791 RepID=UPI0035245329